MEIRKSAQLEHKNRDMACHLQELEALYSSSFNQLMSIRSSRLLPSTIQVGVPMAGQTKSTQAPSKQDDHIKSTAVDGDE
jgi:hypothetical protein